MTSHLHTPMNAQERDTILLAQRNALVLPRFDDALAWRIGSELKSLAEQDGLRIAFEIRISRETVFFYAMEGTSPANADWIRRKRNTVELLHESSYAVGRGCLGMRPQILETMGLSPRDHAIHGGAIPLRLASAGVVGVLTVSGAPDHIDHNLAVTALARVSGQQVPLLPD